MISLSLGLFTLAAALCLAPFARPTLADWVWGICGSAALLVFLTSPAPFSHVLAWAVAGLMICLSDRACGVDGFVKAALAGFLLGAAAKVVPLVLAGLAVLDGEIAFVGICLLVPLTGFLQWRGRGAAVAVLSGILALGPLADAAGDGVALSAPEFHFATSSLSGATFPVLEFGVFA